MGVRGRGGRSVTFFVLELPVADVDLLCSYSEVGEGFWGACCR
jgi:hypothetical protein